MLTFSINAKIDNSDKIKKVVKLIKSMNQQNADDLTDAFLNVVLYNGNITNLNGFSSVCKKNKQIDMYRNKSKTKSLVTTEEQGDKEIDVADAEGIYDIETNCIANADTTYYKETFLDLRTMIYYKKGQDIWRLLTLIRMGDLSVVSKFRILIDEFEISVFIKEFLSNSLYILSVEEVLGR